MLKYMTTVMDINNYVRSSEQNSNENNHDDNILSPEVSVTFKQLTVDECQISHILHLNVSA